MKIYDLDNLDSETKVTSIELPVEMDDALDYARADRKKATKKFVPKLALIREGVAIILEAHHALKKHGVFNTLDILRAAFASYVKQAEILAKKEKINVREALEKLMGKGGDSGQTERDKTYMCNSE